MSCKNGELRHIDSGITMPVHISPSFIRYEVERRRKSKRFRKTKGMGIAFASFLVVGTGVALADTNVLQVIARFTHVSDHESGYITGYTFSPPGGSYDVEEGAEGGNITSDGYTEEIKRYIGIPFPKLELNDGRNADVTVDVVDRAKGYIEISVRGLSESANGLVGLDAYHNLSKKLVFDGDTIDPGVSNALLIDGIPVTYLQYSNPHTTMRFLIWKKSNWTLVLSGDNVSEDSLIALAKKINKQDF
jgi:hypothetical protein